MKTINNYISESSTRSRYAIKFAENGKKGYNTIFSNDWQKDVDRSWDWYEVYDMSKSNFSEPDAVIAWHGEDCSWAQIIKNSENPEEAPKWATILKSREIELLKKREK